MVPHTYRPFDRQNEPVRPRKFPAGTAGMSISIVGVRRSSEGPNRGGGPEPRRRRRLAMAIAETDLLEPDVPEPGPDSRRWKALAGLSLLQFLTVIDITVA